MIPRMSARTTTLTVTGPYDLREVALMGFGHRDESAYDGVMRMAFCLDGDLERQVGVAVREDGDTLELTVRPAGTRPRSRRRGRGRGGAGRAVVSVDHDGAAFHTLCEADPVLAPVHAIAPGFRPALFYSPYEAAIWSVVSARRARAPGHRGAPPAGAAARGDGRGGRGGDRGRPDPGACSGSSRCPGLPADRVPRLHAVAEAAQRGELDVEALRALPQAEAEERLQRLPGIGPFYSSLIVVRACGHADAMVVGELPRPRCRAGGVRLRPPADPGGADGGRRDLAAVPDVGAGDAAGAVRSRGGARPVGAGSVSVSTRPGSGRVDGSLG